MDFAHIALLIYLTFKNSTEAKLKDLNPYLYGALTVIMFLFGEFIGFALVVLVFQRGEIDFAKAQLDERYRDQAAAQIAQSLYTNPLNIASMLVIAFGGYLIVRYMIERVPEKKKNLDLWPDQENANS